MGAMKAVLPVFFLLALGFTARVCRWITPQQNEGARTIVFQVYRSILRTYNRITFAPCRQKKRKRGNI